MRSISVADYGHNPDAMRALVQAVEAMPAKKRSVVISGAGDRRDQDISEQTKILGKAFDDVVLYQDACQRGREGLQRRRQQLQRQLHLVGRREGSHGDRRGLHARGCAAHCRECARQRQEAHDHLCEPGRPRLLLRRRNAQGVLSPGRCGDHAGRAGQARAQDGRQARVLGPQDGRQCAAPARAAARARRQCAHARRAGDRDPRHRRCAGPPPLCVDSIHAARSAALWVSAVQTCMLPNTPILPATA